MNWIFLVLLTATFYGIYNFFIKVASGAINQILGAVILQVIATLLGVVALLYLRLTNTTLDISTKGIQFAILAGIFVGLAEITSFYVFSRGVSASIGIPIIIGGSVVAGSTLGIVFLKESLSPIQYLAVIMITVGTVILSLKR